MPEIEGFLTDFCRHHMAFLLSAIRGFASGIGSCQPCLPSESISICKVNEWRHVHMAHSHKVAAQRMHQKRQKGPLTINRPIVEILKAVRHVSLIHTHFSALFRCLFFLVRRLLFYLFIFGTSAFHPKSEICWIFYLVMFGGRAALRELGWNGGWAHRRRENTWKGKIQ